MHTMWSILFTLVASSSSAAAPDFAVAAYLPNYRYATLRERRTWTTTRVTSLMLFSAEPRADGELIGVEKLVPSWLLGSAGDTPFVAPQRNAGEALRTFMKRRQRARLDQKRSSRTAMRAQRNTRLLLSIGGAGRSQHFGAMAASPAARTRFAQAAATACLDFGLDGVDLDWEAQWVLPDLIAVLDALREALRPLDALLTIALHPWQDIGKAGFALVDRVHLMAYDVAPGSFASLSPSGRHTSFALSVAMIKQLEARGWELSKVVLGIPAYARPLPVTGAADVATYSELVARRRAHDDAAPPSSSSWGKDVDGEALYDGLAFDDVATVRRKTRWAKERGLGGVFLWEAGQDTAETATSLLHAMAKAAEVRASSEL